MILSILIPTTSDRAKLLNRIKSILEPQIIPDKVELLINYKARPVTTGQKRNELIKDAKGKYTVFVDDDDWVPPYYVEEILKAAESNPDCITFRGWMTTNGAHRVNFILRKDERYEERGGVYYRFPNHITPIKKEITSKVLFPDVTEGEDFRWAKSINTLGLIKSEVYIDKEMYHYDFWENKKHGLYK